MHEIDSDNSGEQRRRNVFFWMLVAASSLASLASFWTTYSGLALYVTWPLALAASLAVQAGLFALAWFLGLSNTRGRPLIVGLFLFTMTFSMLFSYVTFQSELSGVSASRTVRNRLIDRLRGDLGEMNELFNQGAERGAVLESTLLDWQRIEAEQGYLLEVCDAASDCYLQAICVKVRTAIGEWEERRQQAYRQGPGKELIYELLASEAKVVRTQREQLDRFRATLSADPRLLSPEIDNLARIQAYDELVRSAPATTLEELLCDRETMLPPPPTYQDFDRDRALDEQLPAYAFKDLVALFEPERKRSMDDLWTLLALGLAAFLDLFVLIIALVGSPFFYRDGDARAFPLQEAVPASWDGRLIHRIDGWITGAAEGLPEGLRDRIAFVRRVIAGIKMSGEGKARLVPEASDIDRFGRLLAAEGGARRQALMVDGEEISAFALEPWVLPALTRYLRLAVEAPG